MLRKCRSSRLLISVSISLSCFVLLLIYLPHTRKALRPLTLTIESVTESNKVFTSCSHHTCFDIESCILEYPEYPPNQIRIFVYPELSFIDQHGNQMHYKGGRDFRQLVNIINQTKYAVSDPAKACIFVSLMNFDHNSDVSSAELLKLVSSFPWHGNKRNHLVFDLNFVRQFSPNRFPSGSFRGIIAGSGINSRDFRSAFDVSLPVFQNFDAPAPENSNRLYLISIVQKPIDYCVEKYIDDLAKNSKNFDSSIFDSIVVGMDDSFVVYKKSDLSLNRISQPYKSILASSMFCLIDQSQPPYTLLFEAMQAGCIPVFLKIQIALPFAEKLDWTKCSVRIPRGETDDLMDVICAYSVEEITAMQKHVRFFYSKYMSSLSAMVTTTLDIINSRVFPEHSPSHNEWNHPPSRVPSLETAFPSVGQAVCNGYTLVLATGSHFKYLNSTLNFLINSAYLREIFILWTGHVSDIPSATFVPKLPLHTKVVVPLFDTWQQTVVKLPETSSSALLVVLEDTVLPDTMEEVDFAYEVWCQHPNRVVTVSMNVPPERKTFSEPTFFHKVYVSHVTELLANQLSVLLPSSSSESCAEVALPSLATRLSGRPALTVATNTTAPRFFSPPAQVAPVSQRREECLQRLSTILPLPKQPGDFVFTVRPL